VRLFFAACPNGETSRRIAAAAHALEFDDRSRRVPVENYHMTLAFAGEVPNSQAAALRAVGPTLRFCKFSLRFDTYEHWPKPEVVVVAASKCPPALEQLQRTLRAELVHRGLAIEPRASCEPFHAHVTIARKVAQAPVFQAMSEFSWTVTAFHLMRSARSGSGSGSGSVYTVVDSWSLLDNASCE
jgi:2'-5' RNA ligase